jgi:hypothetical protein
MNPWQAPEAFPERVFAQRRPRQAKVRLNKGRFVGSMNFRNCRSLNCCI